MKLISFLSAMAKFIVKMIFFKQVILNILKGKILPAIPFKDSSNANFNP